MRTLTYFAVGFIGFCAGALVGALLDMTTPAPPGLLLLVLAAAGAVGGPLALRRAMRPKQRAEHADQVAALKRLWAGGML